jgi:hypothetical protein
LESLRSDPGPGGLPHWSLWAAVPVVLVLGFVIGMALASYGPGRAPLPKQPGSTAAPGGQNAANTPSGSAAVPQADSSWRIVTPSADPPPPSPAHPWDIGRVDGRTEPAPPKIQFTGPANDIIEARKALAADYSEFKTGDSVLRFEYQQMRGAAGLTSVVGMIAASDYPKWEAALRMDPDALERWLENAARRVQSAAIRDRFHVAWAVIDVQRDLPYGFADYEVIPLENRSFLITRPLAATVDHTQTEISVRPLESLAAAAANKPAAATSPWATYGPLLRFDTTDIYRPAGASSTQPIRR